MGTGYVNIAVIRDGPIYQEDPAKPKRRAEQGAGQRAGQIRVQPAIPLCRISPVNDSANDKTPAGPWPRRLARILRPVRWAAYVALAGAAALVFTPAGNWLGDRLIRVDPVEQADYIVVLGGDVERSVEAARLYREGWASKVIVSSLGQDVEHYGRVLAMFGVPESAILYDRQSDRTAAHPASIAGLAGIDREKTRLIVVTSLYHTSRARACFVQAGYRHIAMRAPTWRIYQHDKTELGWAYRFSELPAWIRELSGWGMYRLRGWL